MNIRASELVLMDYLENIRDITIKKHDIEDNYLLADIEFMMIELCEYGIHFGLNPYKDNGFSESELKKVLKFHSSKKSISSIIAPADAQYIINLLFDLKIDIF